MHHDLNKEGPGEGGWWIYPNGSDTQPVPGLPGESETSAGYISPQLAGEFLIPLEAYPETQSPWELLDASGGGAEWSETFRATGPLPRDATRIFDGQSAGRIPDVPPPFDDNDDLPWQFGAAAPGSLFLNTSFRVASAIPSPATGSVAAVITLLTTIRRRP
ncbi:MAG: hypothetical protein AAGK09_11295 [Planctomycetota bacterium]